MPFERLNESFYDHEITLPVGDRDFTIPSPDSDTGLFVQRVVVLGMQAAQNQPLTEDDQKFLSEAPDMTSDQLLDMILTPDIHAEVKAARLNWGAYQKIIGTCMQWVAFGREAAEAFWNAKEGESDPNPPAPQDHRSPSKQASGGQSRGTSTKKKAPAKKASGNPAKRAAGSAGSTSSGNGRSSRRTSSSSTASRSGTRTTTKQSPGTG
jgi:hypothetical protein